MATITVPPVNAPVWTLLDVLGEFIPIAFIYGPPGTGKTREALTAGLGGRKAYRYPFTADTNEAEIRGHYIPKEGHFEWHDGPAMLAYRTGGRFVADEITRAEGAALAFMLALLDGNPIILPNDDVVEPHPDFECWATSNDGPESLSDALADRFVVRIDADSINPAALSTLPENVAKAVSTTPGGVTFREATEFCRLRAKVGQGIAARLVWQKRGPDVLYAMKLAAKVGSNPLGDEER